MKRRQSFLRIAMGVLASIGVSVIHTCKVMADHFSRYAWPSYPNESSLRKHLRGHPHYFSIEKVNSMSFEQLRLAHDDHHVKTGGKPPPDSRLWMNNVYKKNQSSPPENQSQRPSSSPTSQYRPPSSYQQNSNPSNWRQKRKTRKRHPR